MAAWFLAVLAAAVFVAGCAGEETPEPRKVAGLAGQIVEVGGRYLYFECVGSGSPTVLLEAGFGGSSRDWRDVQPQIGTATRTCSYDRAGLGGSPPIPGLHDAGDEIDDLEVLLERADIDPPYVLVGHSYGGALARLYAHRHPDQVTGVVLVDAVHPEWRQRLLATAPRAPELAPFRRSIVDGVDLRAGELLDRRVRSLGTTRLVVVAAGRSTPADAPPSLERRISSLWESLQNELALLSSDSVHVIAERSDHVVQSRLTGQPAVVIRAVQAVVDAHRRDAPLPPCVHIFSGPGVRCRR